jgi:DNA helicase II / ATP-dependent DNA helicase PcrA
MSLLQPLAEIPAKPTKNWSPYQEAVFRAFTAGHGNLVIEACAGSGKTTTLVEALRRWQDAGNRGKRALFCAFNKSIAEELGRRVPAGVDSKTLHSLCFGAVSRKFRGIRVEGRKLHTIAEMVTKAEMGTTDMMAVNAVIGDLAKVYGLLLGTMTNLADADAVAETISAYGATLDLPAASLPLLNELDQTMKSTVSEISFDEMLSFPISHSIALPKYDLICVDEAQDLNRLQIELLKRALAPGGRLVACGDSFQAIYLFRGADAQAMEQIKEEFSVTAGNCLPLSITYRCPRTIVTLAQTWVPHIQAADNAAEGEVIERTPKEFDVTLRSLMAGAMVVCRTNAPLIGTALRLIASGKKAVVRGRDIGKTVAKLATKLAKGLSDRQVDELAERIETYRSVEMGKMAKAHKDSQAQQIDDQCETLMALLKGIALISALHTRIADLFSDDAVGILCSSAHRAKGLEAKMVVWLAPEKNDMMQERARNEAAMKQEKNICYITSTRAIETLIIQPLPVKEKDDEA